MNESKTQIRLLIMPMTIVWWLVFVTLTTVWHETDTPDALESVSQLPATLVVASAPAP